MSARAAHKLPIDCINIFVSTLLYQSLCSFSRGVVYGSHICRGDYAVCVCWLSRVEKTNKKKHSQLLS